MVTAELGVGAKGVFIVDWQAPSRLTAGKISRWMNLREADESDPINGITFGPDI